MLLLALLFAQDTLRLRPPPDMARFDGVAGVAGYGSPQVEIQSDRGAVRLWLTADSASVTVAIETADTTASWNDAISIFLDPWGDRGAAPGHDDFQWSFRRLLDSSVVYRGESGRWRPPRDDPNWRIGSAREGGGWEVRSSATAEGWLLELRLDAAWFDEAKAGPTGLAVLVFDADRSRWVAWPASQARVQPVAIERRPDRWGIVLAR